MPCPATNLSRGLVLINDLLNSSLQRLGVCTNNLGDLLFALEDQKGRHDADTQLLGDVREVIDIEFRKVDVGELFAEFDDVRGNDLARSAPGCKCVDDDEFMLLQSSREFGLVCDVVDTHFGGCGGEVSWCERLRRDFGSE